VTSEQQVPPQDQQAEQATLGAMLIAREAIAEVRAWLKPEDFYGQVHRRICEAIYALFDTGEAVDPVAAATWLRDHDHLDDCGGQVYLWACLDAPATHLQVAHYGRTVRDASERRALIVLGRDLQARAQATATGWEQTRTEALEAVARWSAMTAGHDQSWQKAGPVVMRIVDAIAQQRDQGTGILLGVETGLSELDSVTSGLHPGELLVLAARPSHGKTALALQIAIHAALHGTGAAFVSLEQSADSLGRRAIAHIADVAAEAVRLNYVALDEHWQRVVDGAGKLYGAPLFFWDVGSATIADLRARLCELTARERIGLVVVDYLQLLKLPTRSDMRTGTTENVRALKAMAKEFGLPFIVLSQLSRSVEREHRRPMLSDLRETGAIEDEADRVVFIWFEDPANRKQGGEAYLLLEKNRNGRCRDFRVFWTPSRLRFSQIAPEAEE